MPDSLIDLAGLSVSAEDFLVAVLESTAQPIWVVDPADLIRFANPAAIEALGYDDAEQLFGRHGHETIHYRRPDGTPFPAAECPLLLPRATGETVMSDLDWFFRRDGSMFPVSYVSVPIEMREGRGAVVAFTDIEDRLRAERVLREHDAILAKERAALRRVATLVAGGESPAAVFAAVAREVAQVLRVATVHIWRYEPDGTGTVVGAWSDRPDPFKAGSNWPFDHPTIAAAVEQAKSGRAVNIDHTAGLGGVGGDAAREIGLRSSAAAPIVVDGEPWGIIAGGLAEGELVPDRVEDRLAEFTELVATAISNVQARSDLAASRARIVAATDEERRRVVRDLHDGAQQRLVHTILTLKLAQTAVQSEQDDVPTLLSEALDHAQQATAELRELAHGILPSALTQGGLRAGVNALASRMPVPVEIDVSVGRLPTAIEATAYFVVAEALTNVAKHANATGATVRAHVEHGTLQLQVRDDGVGGARPGGSGLVGLADRLAALDGQLRVDGPAGGGTLVAADIPLPG